jgi:hypothetical protein
MRKPCAVCGTPFEAKRPAAKFCGDRCRQRAHRRPEAVSESKAVELPSDLVEDPPVGSVTTATVAELERAGRLETAVGQTAIALARRIDSDSAETGASMAALARQHLATLTEALRDAQTAADPLDELRSRRERKRGAG